MKKAFFAIIVIVLASCTASKETSVYKKSTTDLLRYNHEFQEGKITAAELETLTLGEEDYLKYFAR